MTWQSYIVWPCSSPAWKLQFGIKSTGRHTNKVVMQNHLKFSGMTYNYKEIFHSSYQEDGSHIWIFELASLSEMQVPDQRVKLQNWQTSRYGDKQHTQRCQWMKSAKCTWNLMHNPERSSVSLEASKDNRGLQGSAPLVQSLGINKWKWYCIHHYPSD